MEANYGTYSCTLYTPGPTRVRATASPWPESPAFSSFMLPHLASASYDFLTLPSAAPS